MIVGPRARPGEGVGWDVVAATAAAAQASFGSRLAAVYALGSLAHGGFAPLVSDVDVALVLAGHCPEPGDGERVDTVVAAVHTTGLPLSPRLSVFWGATATLRGENRAGRFPPVDRLDVLRHGVLIRGSDVRPGAVEPTAGDLLRGGAEFAVEVLGRPDRRRDILDARHTAGGGPRPASKVALFPVRFLYTARTGQIGLVDAAITHYLAAGPGGPGPDLIRAAAQWRHRWSGEDASGAVRLLELGAVALYTEFVGEYVPRLRRAGLDQLAGRLTAWGDGLGA